MTVASLADEFICARSYAPRSARQRRTILAGFARHVPTFLADVTPSDVVAWWSTTEHLAPASRRAYHGAVGGFLHWCRACGHPCPDLAAIVRRPAAPRSTPRVLTHAEVDALTHTPMPWKRRLIVTLMLELGLRSVDIAGLRGEDIDHEAGTIAVTGKGGHRDALPLPEIVAGMVPPYTTGPVAPATAETVAKEALLALRSAGIAGHTGHSLRRTFATHAVERGVDIRTVQALLRHQSLRSTDHYVAGPDLERMRRAIDAA